MICVILYDEMIAQPYPLLAEFYLYLVGASVLAGTFTWVGNSIFSISAVCGSVCCNFIVKHVSLSLYLGCCAHLIYMFLLLHGLYLIGIQHPSTL